MTGIKTLFHDIRSSNNGNCIFFARTTLFISPQLVNFTRSNQLCPSIMNNTTLRNHIFLIFLIPLAFISCGKPASIREAILTDKSNFYYIDFKEYPSGNNPPSQSGSSIQGQAVSQRLMTSLIMRASEANHSPSSETWPTCRTEATPLRAIPLS